MNINTSLQPQIQQIKLYYKFSAANWNLFTNYINRNCNHTSSITINSTYQIDSMCNSFISLLNRAADFAIPKRPLKNNHSTRLPSNILLLIRLRNSERRKWLRYRYDSFLDSTKLLDKLLANEIETIVGILFYLPLKNQVNPFGKFPKSSKKRFEYSIS